MNTAAGFAALGLSPEFCARAVEAGWRAPTAIQQAALPAVLQGRDVLGLAPTGTGKTAAFMLPLLQRLRSEYRVLLERPRRLRALVLAPTRELAAQLAVAVKVLAPELKTVVAVGGLSINPQMMALRGGAHLVVATPGRLLDLLAHNALRLDELQCLVLDEADRLLDLGFADEVGRVLAALPAQRQTLMFTATLPERVAQLAARVLREPVRVDARSATPAAAGAGADAIAGAGAGAVAGSAPGAQAGASAAAGAAADAAADNATTSARIHQRAIEVDSARRTALLRHLVQTERWPRALVFVATQYAAEHVADKLRQGGVAATALHGRQSSGRRQQALADLASGAVDVLVATDLAARGIDIANLEVVVNHDLPRSALDHIHRIGRTGRAGARGLAMSFVCPDLPGSETQFRLIEKRQQQRVARERVAGFEPKSAAPEPTASGQPGSDPHGGVKGRRPNKKDRLRALARAGRAAA